MIASSSFSSATSERYDILRVKTLSSGKQVFAVSRPTSITIDPNNTFSIVTSDRDRMDIIAKNVYGSVLSWWKISSANQVNNGSLHLPAGTQLYIPQ